MKKGLAWWGRDTSYGDSTGLSWQHGGFMHGVRTHIYVYPPHLSNNNVEEKEEARKKNWKGFIILTNGESNYFEIECSLKRGLLL